MNITDVSVNEHNQIEVSVYPNPATDFVKVSSEQIERVEVYNMMGQRVEKNTRGLVIYKGKKYLNK